MYPADNGCLPSSPLLKHCDSSTPVHDNEQQQAGKSEEEEEVCNEIIEEKFQRCKYCQKQFDFGDEVPPDDLCPSAPNKLREHIDKFCCVQCYKGAWYHLTKDTLDDEGQDIGRCVPGGGMTTGYWCLLGFLSVVCAPCLVLWCPLNVCELVAQQVGLTGGPHSLTTIKKKTTMVHPKRKDTRQEEEGGYNNDDVITEQPRCNHVTEEAPQQPLRVTVSVPMEDELEEAAQQRMMGFHVDEDEQLPLAQNEQHIPTALTRVTPHVQRAQSELAPSVRTDSSEIEMSVQRSHSQSEIQW